MPAETLLDILRERATWDPWKTLPDPLPGLAPKLKGGGPVSKAALDLGG